MALIIFSMQVNVANELKKNQLWVHNDSIHTNQL